MEYARDPGFKIPAEAIFFADLKFLLISDY